MRFFQTEICAEGVSAPLRCYIPDDCGRTSLVGKRPAVIIYPGGGYGITYSGEAEPIALKYCAAGICAFILDYSCAPVHFPVPQLQAFYAIRYVREHAEEFGIQKDNISTTGFSAGGHLCGCTGTLWNKPCFAKWLGKDPSVYRPDKLILCYPVIEAGTKYAHEGSFINLFGKENITPENLALASLEKQIDNDTPPAFIWHTSEDGGVPIHNSLSFAAGLADYGTHLELHIYRHGDHGLCLGNCVTDDRPWDAPHIAAEWIEKAIAFAFDTQVLPKLSFRFDGE